jgi:hypothetical protein
MTAMIAEKCSGETGIAFAITEHTANQIYPQAMILWAAVHFNAWSSIG